MQDTQDLNTSKKLNFSLWKKLFIYTKGYRKSMFLVGFFMAITSSIDVVFPLLNKYALDTVIPRGDLGALLPFGLLALGLMLLSAFSVLMFIYIANKVNYGIQKNVRSLGFQKLQTLPFSYYDRMPSGYLMSRMTSDINNLGGVFSWTIVDVVWSLFYLVLSLVAMFQLSVKLTLINLVALVPISLVSRYFMNRILDLSRAVRKKNSELTDSFSEGIQGAKTSKTLVLEDKNIFNFNRQSDELAHSSIKSAMVSALFRPILTTICAFAIGLIVSLSTGMVKVGEFSIGSISAFFSFTMNLFDPITGLAFTMGDLKRMQASAERVIGLLDTEPDIKDSPEVERVFGDSFRPKHENWPELKGDIEFKNVSFKYTDGEKVLENFNLKIDAGQTIALVGKTGSGKSTLVNLICRFYEPTEGEILIDGVDYRKRSQLWLQSRLGYVLQQPQLFSGTIRDNIKYAKPDASEEEINEAIDRVYARGFISRLEKGLDTEVGEGGAKLSTGEKQLISFARAIIIAPRIFVLDEATSSIDTETEQAIQNAIEKSLSGRTAFIIAHRLSTIKNADRILLINDGKVLEDGTHAELMAKKKEYYTLYTNQFSKEESERAIKNFSA